MKHNLLGTARSIFILVFIMVCAIASHGQPPVAASDFSLIGDAALLAVQASPDAEAVEVVVEVESLELFNAEVRDHETASGKVVAFDVEGAEAKGEVELDPGVYTVYLYMSGQDPEHDAVYVAVGETKERVYPSTHPDLSNSETFSIDILEKKKYPISITFGEPGVLLDRLVIQPIPGQAVTDPVKDVSSSADAISSVAEKHRVLVLTDIENEPDDAMSMVRFLTYSNQFDVEGLVATTSVHQKKKTAAWRIKEIVEAYGQVRDNLELHEPGYPKAEYLLSVIKEGRPAYGMDAVGEGKDSSGSELLIAAVDRDDPRPLWVSVWGGPNVLAQALWKIRATRSPEALEKVVVKLRVYTISDQDDSGPWIRKTFPKLFYIVSPGLHSGGAYHYATWSGISGDNFHARFTGADYSIVDNPWFDKHIRCKGPLGKQYPFMKYLMEGDTPSFLGLVNNGLNVSERPDWGGWGGRYELYTPRKQKWHLEAETRPFWSDSMDEVLGVDGRWHTSNHATIWRWRAAYQNDFAARMDWTIKPYNAANHPPIPKLGHPAELTAKRGELVNLSAEGTTDPDGDAVSYEWFYYGEAGTFTVSSARSGQPVVIQNFDQPKAWFTVPTKGVMPPGTGTIHIILAVTDKGTPPLTRYQRVIVDIK